MFELYHRAFDAGNDAFWWGGEIIYRSWDQNTMFLYFGIVLSAMIVGLQIDSAKTKYVQMSAPNNMRLQRYSSTKKKLVLFLCAIAFILGSRDYTVGIDTIVYQNAVNNAVSLNQVFSDTTTEPIYKILVYLLHNCVGSGKIAVFLYSFATISFVYLGLKRYIGDISVYVCLMAYICIYYFPAMNLVRMYLAASIVFAAMHFFIEENYKKFYLIFGLACLIHYSTTAMFLPLCMYHVYQKNKALAFTGISILTVIILVSVSVLGDYVALLNRYSTYISGNTASGGIGIMLFVDYLPAIYLLYYISNNKIQGKMADLTICFTASALVIRLLAYNLSAATRLHAHFMFLTVILIPYWAWYMKSTRLYNYKIFIMTCTVWALFRLHVYFTGYLAGDGIMPYMIGW